MPSMPRRMRLSSKSTSSPRLTVAEACGCSQFCRQSQSFHAVTCATMSDASAGDSSGRYFHARGWWKSMVTVVSPTLGSCQ